MSEPGDTTDRLGRLLLHIGANLMSSGANTARIRTTLERIASAFHCEVDVLVTHRAIMLTLSRHGDDYFFSRLKRTSPHGVNFSLVSGVSRMSWRVVQEGWTTEQVETELARLTALPHFPRWQVLLSVGAAGAAFCRLFGGGGPEMLVAFVATLLGLFVRQETAQRRFNPYLCTFFAATVSALVAGLSVHYHWGQEPQYALSTSVLYLVPGVPLINFASDLIDGNLMNGLVRGAHGLMISSAIALGLLVAFLVYRIQ